MGKWSLRLGWALMTETLIKWRRDLLYCHPSHNLCPTSQVVLGINTETTKILLQKIGKHWQYRNNLWNMWQSIFKIVFWLGLFLTVLALGMIISIFSSFGDLNSNFLKIKMTYSSKNLSRYMIQKEKKKIKTEVGWNFCQLMKTLDFWALCREIPFWWLLPMCKFFVFSGICVSVSVYICSTLNCHAVPANADESVSVSLAQRDDPKQ